MGKILNIDTLEDVYNILLSVQKEMAENNTKLLIAVDLDDTAVVAQCKILRTANAKARSELFKTLEASGGKDLIDAVYAGRTERLVEPALLKLQSHIMAQDNMELIGFTMRRAGLVKPDSQETSEDKVARTLKRDTGLEFTVKDPEINGATFNLPQTDIYNKKMAAFYRWDNPSVKHGILFSSNYRKGPVAKEFLRTYPYDVFMMIDDSIENIEEIDKNIEALNAEFAENNIDRKIQFIGMVYHGAKHLDNELNSEVSSKQLEKILETKQYISEQEVKNMLLEQCLAEYKETTPTKNTSVDTAPLIFRKSDTKEPSHHKRKPSFDTPPQNKTAKKEHSPQTDNSPSNNAKEQFSVLSYNIQLSGLDVLGHEWEKRKKPIVEKIGQHDVALLQELSHEQLIDLQETMKEYTFVSINTVTGQDLYKPAPNTQEGLVVAFNHNLFDFVEEHHTWLSDTPDVPSQNWGTWETSFPKLIQKVVLSHKLTQETIAFYNSHFCHEDDPSQKINPRLESSKIELQQISEDLKKGYLVVSGGDRNTHLPRDQEVLNRYHETAELEDVDTKNEGINTTFIGYPGHPRLNPITKNGLFEKQMNLDRVFFSHQGLNLVQSVVRSGLYNNDGALIDAKPVFEEDDKVLTEERQFASDHAAVTSAFKIRRH